MLTRVQLREAFCGAGLVSGDLVLVHSSLRKLGPVEGGADTVIDALLEVVGGEGTVAVPTHTWAVVGKGSPVYDQELTPSNVGVLTNVFRARQGAVRGLHPTHSVAAIGARAEEFVAGQEKDQSPCPAAGPYGRLCDWGGKVLIIGAELDCCTLFHGCEEWSGMPWAVSKEPVQLCIITKDGREIAVEVHHHYVNTWDQYPNLEPHLVEAGIMRVTQIGQCALRLLDAKAAADWLVAELQRDASIILPE